MQCLVLKAHMRNPSACRCCRAHQHTLHLSLASSTLKMIFSASSGMALRLKGMLTPRVGAVRFQPGKPMAAIPAEQSRSNWLTSAGEC